MELRICTPFDYRRDEDGCDDVYYIIDERGTPIANIPFWDESDTDHAARAEALARLFAAAPSLLSTLERFESAWRQAAEFSGENPGLNENSQMLRIYDEARAAIALAKTG